MMKIIECQKSLWSSHHIPMLNAFGCCGIFKLKIQLAGPFDHHISFTSVNYQYVKEPPVLNQIQLLIRPVIYPRTHVVLLHLRPCLKQLHYSCLRLKLSQHQDKTCVLQNPRLQLSHCCMYYAAIREIRFFSS